MAAEWERSQAEHARRKKEEQRIAYESLQGVSLGTFETSWKNSRDFRGQTTAAAVDALTRQLGFEAHFGSARTAFERITPRGEPSQQRIER